MKTHHWAGVTLSLKNLFGTLPGRVYGWPKNILHWAGIERSILDIAGTVQPSSRSSTASWAWRAMARSPGRRSDRASSCSQTIRLPRIRSGRPHGFRSRADRLSRRGGQVPRSGRSGSDRTARRGPGTTDTSVLAPTARRRHHRRLVANVGPPFTSHAIRRGPFRRRWSRSSILRSRCRSARPAAVLLSRIGLGSRLGGAISLDAPAAVL